MVTNGSIVAMECCGVYIKQTHTARDKNARFHFTAHLVLNERTICQQECIPVGCRPHVLYCTVTETPLGQRCPWTKTPSPWTETPWTDIPDREPLGQRPLDKTPLLLDRDPPIGHIRQTETPPLDRDPSLDRDPLKQRPAGQRPPANQTGNDIIQRPPSPVDRITDQWRA